MKAKIALVLSLLLVIYLFVDGIDVRTDLDDAVEEEVSSIDALVSSVRLKDSWRVRSRRSTLSGGFGVQTDDFLSAARVKKPPIFAHPELYILQQVYRL